MADSTGISWTDRTFNPWIGCSKVSPACARCYAETFSVNRMGLRVWGDDASRRIAAESSWKKPVTWNRESERYGRSKLGGGEDERIRVFCASMADVFEDRPELEEPRRRLFDLIAETPSLDWLLLTKRPEFARRWLREWYEEDLAPPSASSLFRLEGDENWSWRDDIRWAVLPNLWMGVSIENARFTWRADILRDIPASVRFISAEPLLGSLFTEKRASLVPLNLDGIDWVIGGGESGGRAARPTHPEWARELRDACLERHLAFHWKQNGSWGPASAGVYPGDVCWSLDPSERYVVGEDYVCAPNESVGEWLRYQGPSPKASGKLLDGAEWCEFPGVAVA